MLENFYEIFTDLKSQRSELDHHSCILASTAILQELGKYRRSRMLSESRLEKMLSDGGLNNGEPATEKQKSALKKFGIEFKNGITKSEAYQLISEAIEKRNNNRR